MFYLDTSIWLDFLEDRNEPNMPKSDWAKELIRKIKAKEDEIIFSDINLIELMGAGYNEFELDGVLYLIDNTIVKVEATKKQLGVAKDLSYKRGVPRRDALHALIARENHAILVTLDHDFLELTDIIKSHRTNEFL